MNGQTSSIWRLPYLMQFMINGDDEMKKKRLAIGSACFLLLLWLLYSLRAVFVPFIYAFLLAYLLEPLVCWLEEKGFRRGRAILLIYLLFGIATAGIIYFALPALTFDLNRILAETPQYTQQIQASIHEFRLGYQNAALPEGVRQVIDQLLYDAGELIQMAIRGFFHGIVLLFSQAFNLILAPILCYYLLLEFNSLGQTLLPIVPVRYRRELSLIGTEISTVIKRFIQGNLLVALLVGILGTTGFFLIGMDYPLLLGIMMGATNFIPYFGAVLAAIPALILALLKSKWLALYALGLVLLIQQLEGNIITPKILGKSIGLHPLAVILAMLIGGELFGLAGLLFAVPVAAVLRIIAQHVFRLLV